MPTVTFEVNPTTAQWGYDEETYASGTQHTVEVEADGDFAAVLAAADAAGAISIKEGADELPNSHIESDEESLAFREQVEELRHASQGERDEYVRQVERELAPRVADSDDDYNQADLSADLQESVNELDRELHGTEIDELKGA